MQSISIRDAVREDAWLIRELAYKIWPVTYNEILTLQQLEYMLALLYDAQALQDQMQKGISFIIANEGDDAVGFASWGQVDKDTYKLHKLYVVPSQQGKGTGRLMIDHVINDIKSKGARTLQLNVNRYNKARHFYEKLGFTIIKEEDVDIGNGHFMNDYVMKREILTHEL